MNICGTEKYLSNRPGDFIPFFSICIPQYNRTDFLFRACETFESQNFEDFELCISDDVSTDGRRGDLLNYLDKSGLIYTYAVTPRNLRYDGNLRSAIGLSNGRYVFLLGNDDGLSDPDVLDCIRRKIAEFAPIGVAITNYREVATGQTFRRVRRTGVLGSGPEMAAETFRNYSFIGGIVFEGARCRQEATDRVDGSEMYQMYLGTRLIAGGGRLLAIDRVCVDKDLQISGQTVDSYRLKPRLTPCPIIKRLLPMGRLLEVVAAGLGPNTTRPGSEAHLLSVARQLYLFTYPFWLFEFRRVQSWRYAFGVLLALSPRDVASGLALSRLGQMRLWLLYLLAGSAGLLVPIRFFDALRPKLYTVAKHMNSRR
jgi:hypothetical protein